MKLLKRTLLLLAVIALLLFGLSKTPLNTYAQDNSELQIATSPEQGGDMKWVLTVRGGKRFPQDFNDGKVTALRLEGAPLVLRNMWEFDANDNVWVWKQYIPENVIGLMIDTPTNIDYEFLQKPAYWRKWWWGNSMFREYVF